MKLARIEPGSFLMGSTKDQSDQFMRLFPDLLQEWFEPEQPQHPVKITRPFFLGIHQVTQGQYEAVMGENPSYFTRNRWGWVKEAVAGQSTEQYPVEQVSWLDAVTFCNKLSAKEGREPFYEIEGITVTVPDWRRAGYRLPTEAEWEYACRAGSTTMCPFGDGVGKLGDHDWYGANSGNITHPVGQKRPNAWGLYDMLGNVHEWCQDWYEIRYYKASPPADPAGPSQASDRVIRGGCCVSVSCRPTGRSGCLPGNRSYIIGFRVAAVQE